MCCNKFVVAIYRFLHLLKNVVLIFQMKRNQTPNPSISQGSSEWYGKHIASVFDRIYVCFDKSVPVTCTFTIQSGSNRSHRTYDRLRNCGTSATITGTFVFCTIFHYTLYGNIGCHSPVLVSNLSKCNNTSETTNDFLMNVNHHSTINIKVFW